MSEDKKVKKSKPVKNSVEKKKHECTCGSNGCCSDKTDIPFVALGATIRDVPDATTPEKIILKDVENDALYEDLVKNLSMDDIVSLVKDYCNVSGKTFDDIITAFTKEKNLKKDILQDLFQACPDIDSSGDNSLKDLVDEWKTVQASTKPAGVKEKRENNKFSSFKKDIMKLADTYPKMFHDFIQTVSLSCAFDNTMLDEDDDELFDDSRTLIKEIRFPINLSTHDTHIQVASAGENSGNEVLLEFEFFTEKPNSYNRLTRYKSYNKDQCADELFDDLAEFLKEHLSVYCNPFS